MSYTWNQILSFEKKFGVHNVSAFIAHESSFGQSKYYYGQKSQFADPNIPEMDNAVIQDLQGSYTTEYALDSYFGQIRYFRIERASFIRRDILELAGRVLERRKSFVCL